MKPIILTVVEEVKEVSNILNEYGPALVILAIFIIIFITVLAVMINSNKKHNNVIIEQNQKYNEELMAQNKKLIDRILEKSNEKTYQEEDIVEIFTKLNDVLKDECKKINDKTECSRSAIYVFHNGTTASHGLPFFKMTCVSEWIKRGSGFNEQSLSHTGMNLTLFSGLVEKLYRNGEFHIFKNRDEIDPDLESLTFSFMSIKAKTAVYVCVYDDNNRIMAFISTEFDQILEEEKIENIKTVVKLACAKIQPVLEFSSYNKKTLK